METVQSSKSGPTAVITENLSKGQKVTAAAPTTSMLGKREAIKIINQQKKEKTTPKKGEDGEEEKTTPKKTPKKREKKEKVDGEIQTIEEKEDHRDVKHELQWLDKETPSIDASEAEVWKQPTISGPIVLQLAKSFDEKKNDPTGWLMSEKLDGVRCFWNGEAMYTRNGCVFVAPDWFKNLLPNDISFDGELWTKRDDFQHTCSIVRRKDKNEEWHDVTYMIYDCPLLKTIFTKRLEICEKKVKEINHPNIQFHKHQVCTGVDQVKSEMERILKLDGEGVMIKNPESFYEQGRSKNLLKCKDSNDTEAEVVGHI